jgi:tetratricopeptide (TPR) repeat protein
LIEVEFSLQKFESALTAFEALSVPSQVDEVVGSLRYFGNLGQAVFVMIGAGLFEERGSLKPWVSPLFQALALNPTVFLFLVSSRQIGEDRLRAFPNAMQIHVPELRDADVRALITGASAAIGLKPLSPSDGVIRTIGGHPDVAKAAVRLVAQRGEMILDQSQIFLYEIQDEVLSDNLDVDALSELQKELLCMLSWVPHLSGNVLQKVLASRHKVTDLDFVNSVDNLILGCLVTPISSNLAMSPAIRAMFRRRYGFGPTNLLKAFSAALSEEWTRSASSGDVSADLFDAFVFMHALEGKSLPPELRQLLLPSTLLEVLRDTYQRGRDDADAWKQVLGWGSIAAHMRMDETVKEEILSTVVRAHIRLEEYTEAEAMLKGFDRAGYRSAEFLRGFALRRQGKIREAVFHLREALASSKYRRFVVQELATCYQKLNMQAELTELTRRHADLIEGSGVLLDFRIGVLITAKRINEAKEAIHKLQRLPQDDGRSIIRRAQIAMQEERDFGKAAEMLTELVQKGIGNPVTTRRWRAIAAVNLGQLGLAMQHIEFIRSRPGQQATADRVEVHFHLAQHDYDAAERALARAQGSSAIDHDVLMARILEERAADVRTPLNERNTLHARGFGNPREKPASRRLRR